MSGSTEEQADPDRWRHRRRIVYGTLIYCAVIVAYLGIWAEETALRTQVALGLLGLAGMVIGSYIAGAVWDDKLQRGKTP
jgi:hypothetical protein